MIKRELEKDPALKNESWERFLPKFSKNNVKRAKKPKARTQPPRHPALRAHEHACVATARSCMRRPGMRRPAMHVPCAASHRVVSVGGRPRRRSTRPSRPRPRRARSTRSSRAASAHREAPEPEQHLSLSLFCRLTRPGGNRSPSRAHIWQVLSLRRAAAGAEAQRARGEAGGGGERERLLAARALQAAKGEEARGARGSRRQAKGAQRHRGRCGRARGREEGEEAEARGGLSDARATEPAQASRRTRLARDMDSSDVATTTVWRSYFGNF